MNKIKLLLVDDHKVVRTGLRLVFENEKNIEIVADVGNGEKALLEVRKHHPDVVISDISMPEMNGIELTERIIADFPNTSVLILSMHNDEEYIIDALEAGAMGYIPKDSDETEIVSAVENLSNGKMYYSSSISDVFARKLIKKKGREVEEKKMTAREMEVIELIVNGYSNKEIATELTVSKRTIDNHRSNLMRKLKARNTADIVRIAIIKELVVLKK